MAVNDSTKVSFGKPKAQGAVFVAPAGTPLPASASVALNAAFTNVGFISDDGLVNTVSTDTEEVHAWGGDLVLMSQSTFMENFTVNLLETNPAALALFYGSGNVSVSGNNITVTQNSAALPQIVVVFDIVMTGGRIKRIVVPIAQVVDRSGDITYSDGDPITYPIVIQAYPDASGNSHVEYIALIGS